MPQLGKQLALAGEWKRNPYRLKPSNEKEKDVMLSTHNILKKTVYWLRPLPPFPVTPRLEIHIILVQPLGDSLE